ncbi:MAG: ATP-binding protein [Gaiellaceae bacterium]
MGGTAPVGREREFQALLDVADEAQAGRGAVVFLTGATGSGKSALLREFAAELALRPRDERPDLELALCYETSAGNPLGPFGEVLRALTNRERRGDRAKRVLSLVKEVAPPLVELIPVIGKLAALGVKAVSEVGIYALGGDHKEQQTELASDVAAALKRIAEDSPLIVVIDDAQWIDAASTEVIARAGLAPNESPLVLVIAYDKDLMDDRHLLAHVRAPLLGRAGVLDLELADLSAEAVEKLLHERYGALPAERLADWLQEVSDGTPLFIENYLASLEQQGVLRHDGGGWTLEGTIDGEPGAWRLGGALAAARPPATLSELLAPRVAELEDDERSLLEGGAVQGRRFLTRVLAQLVERDEREIVRQLRKVGERRRMVAWEDIEDWWSDRSALFTFDPGALQALLNERRTPYELRLDHAAVAKALEELIAEDDPPPRHALLEIARHYEAAREPLEAARQLVAVAESTFAEGAYRETSVHAARAVDLLHEALQKPRAQSPDTQRLLARALLYLILGGETGWRAGASSSNGANIIALAEEAVRAADATGDATLRANARYATGRVSTAYRGLDDAIAAYEGALAIAREAGDSMVVFGILLELGHQLDSVNLERGRDMLESARELLTSGALDASLDVTRRAFEEARLDMSIGVAEFDLGHFGPAFELLVGSSQALRERGRCDDLAWSLAFLAQLYIAIGLYEAAEATLRDAVALFANRQEALGIRGYLNALLGYLYLEWEKPADAREQLAAGRSEANESAFRGVIPLVDAYWVELLLVEGTPEALREAEQTVTALDAFGWPRSQIARASLLGRVALAQGRVDDARASSAQAVAKLDECGGYVTATRGEGILFAHARILTAAGSPEAAGFFARAQQVVRDKAETLADPAHKQSFLERVPLSRAILNAPA